MLNFTDDNSNVSKRVIVPGECIVDRTLEGVEFVVDTQTEEVSFKNPDDEACAKSIFMDIPKLFEAVLKYIKEVTDILQDADTGEDVYNENFEIEP